MSLASSLAAQPKQTLSFDEALNLTLTNNPSIKASTYEQEAAERERKAAYGLRLPKIGVTGAYAYLSEDINIDLNGMKRTGRRTDRGHGRSTAPGGTSAGTGTDETELGASVAGPQPPERSGGDYRRSTPAAKSTLQTMRQRSKSAKPSRKGIKPATRSSPS